MDIFKKKPMLFLFTIITLFICSSSYADNYIPQPRLEDSELRFLSNLPKPVFKLIAKLHSLKALGEKYEDGIEVGVEIVKGIYEVSAKCSKEYNCNEANPLCGGYCLYKLVASGFRSGGCTKHCGKPKENCFFIPHRGVICR
ncbi:hypothetical protein R6Q59_000248 [Mikania micrantha]